MSSQVLNNSLLQKSADLSIAKLHNVISTKQASRVRDLTAPAKLDNEICPCCNMSPSSPQFPLDCDVIDLGQLGIGYPLFFYMGKALFVILAFGSIFAGFACMLDNYLDSGGSLHDKPSNWSSESSVQKGKNPVWQGVIMFIYSLFVIVAIFYFRKFIKDKIVQIDENNVTPSDFTVVVKGVSDKIDLNEFVEYFKQNSVGDSQIVEIAAVSPAYDISEYVRKDKQLKKIKKLIKFIEEFEEKKGKAPERDKWCRKILSKQELLLDVEKIQQWKEDFEKEENLRGSRGDWVFITFRKQSDCKKAIVHWYESEIETLSRILLKCFHKFIYTSHTYNGIPIKIEPAPEPSDIIWENLTVSTWSKLKKRFKTGFTTAILLTMSFYILLSIKIYEFSKYQDYGKISNTDNIKIKSISLLLSVTILLLNVVITKSIRYFSKYEKPATWTQYNVSVFHKLVAATTLNSVGMLLLVNSYDVQQGYTGEKGIDLNWFTKSYGLPSDLCNYLLVDAFFSPFLQIFDPSFIWQLFKRHLVIIGKKKVDQAKANKLWTNPEMDLAQRSARYMTVFLTSLVFAPLFPMGLFLGAISIFIKYFVDKEQLLRRCSRSRNFGPGVTMAVLTWLLICLVAFSVLFIQISNLIVQMISHDLEGKYLVAPSMGIAISAIFVLVPFTRILRKTFLDTNAANLLISQDDDDFFRKAADLNDDYLRSNPVISSKGWKEWLENVEKYKSKEEADEAMLRFSRQILSAGLDHYVENRPSSKNMEELRKSFNKSSSSLDTEENMKKTKNKENFIQNLRNNIFGRLKKNNTSLNSEVDDT